MSEKTLRTCEKGHTYYKSSDCPTCPDCEAERKPQAGFLAALSAPARRALENNGIDSLEKLANHTEAEILKFHGMGKASLPKLRQTLAENNLAFQEPEKPGVAEKAVPGKPETIDAYLAGFPEEVQKVLQQVRETIQKAAPEATEAISYAIPTFKLNGNLIHFAGFKNHIGLYPAPAGIEDFPEDLSAYQAGKGTLQFPLDKPIPFDLIAAIVKFRVKTLSEKVKKVKKSTS